MKLDVDLRSDTVTRPTAAMRSAMASADVGDDVFGDDPTVNRLQERVAELLGKEAALFTPSGSMANQIAIRLHCGRGDEFICEASCHINIYEQGGFSQLSSAIARPLVGQQGVLTLDQLPSALPPLDDHCCRLKLLTLENTHNRGGGTVQPIENLSSLCAWARQVGIATHLDGARLFNAVVASGVSASRFAEGFDSVNICFSKGLGAPMGSAIAGSREFVREARRARKLFGGGMRQVGIVAAGALYALENNIERLAEDHLHAQIIAQAVQQIQGLQLDSEPQTNIVIVRIDPELCSPQQLTATMFDMGIGIVPFGPQHVRLVTHMDVSRPQVDKACEALRQSIQKIRK
jgi:threonine aldolase